VNLFKNVTRAKRSLDGRTRFYQITNDGSDGNSASAGSLGSCDPVSDGELENHQEELRSRASGFILVAMSYVPFIKILAPLPATILGAGFMVFARKITFGERGSVKDLFIVFEDNQKMGELLPIGLLGVGIALLQAFIEKSFPAFIGNLLGFALTLLLVALTTFSAPLIYFKKVQAVRSIELNLQATSLAWRFLLALGLMLAGLAVVCTIALLLPVLLVFLPVALVAGYLTYAALFEGLDIKEVDRKF
jgi:hypothetical protein